MKGTGGLPHGKSLHQRMAQHQRDVAVAGAYLLQLRAQEEVALSLPPDHRRPSWTSETNFTRTEDFLTGRSPQPHVFRRTSLPLPLRT
jgi:hypothetical protein